VQAKWTAALRRCQELNDRVVRADWQTAVDWRGLRVPPPTDFHTNEQKEKAIGSAQRLAPMLGSNGGLASRLHGILPEYFPPAHVGYLMEVMFHPDLIALHRLCLDCHEVYYELAQLLSKAPGDAGGGWHSHPGGGEMDDKRVVNRAALEEYKQQNRVNLVLAYPQGFNPEEEGDAGNGETLTAASLRP
jgi:hypothetical protein